MLHRTRWRIAASYVALIAVVLLGLGIYLVGFLQDHQRRALEAQLERQARLVALAAEERLASGDQPGLQALATQLGRGAGVRVTLIAPDGRVLGDSDHDPATMDNHATRPEVAEAIRLGSGQSQRHSATLEQDLLYVAVPVRRENALVGVARVALPLQDIQAARDRTAAAVAGALALAAILAVVLAVALARLTTGRIQLLVDAARRLAGGNLDQTIAIDARDDLGLLAQTFNDMADRLRTHIRALEAERERLSAVLAHLADGLVIVGHDGLVQAVNPAAARLLGLPAGDVRGRSVMAVVREHQLAALVDEVRAGRTEAGQPRVVEVGPPGHRHVVQAVATPVPGGPRAERQMLLVLQDVTELRRTETVRREFVANVSHELRTPVAALKSLVETLEDGALDEPDAARDFIARMHVEVDQLAQLVEELLELSRIESGQTALRLAPVDLGALVAAAADRLRPQAERQGLRLLVDLPSDLPPVRADAERVQQVVVNLVHNALKFTPPGGWVRVSAASRDGEAAVNVADSGIGIPPEALPRLFERFYKVDRARAGGGTGLGLAIARHIVQAHGGRIWAESAGEGRGATFTFTLPLAAPAEPSANP